MPSVAQRHTCSQPQHAHIHQCSECLPVGFSMPENTERRHGSSPPKLHMVHFLQNATRNSAELVSDVCLHCIPQASTLAIRAPHPRPSSADSTTSLPLRLHWLRLQTQPGLPCSCSGCRTISAPGFRAARRFGGGGPAGRR